MAERATARCSYRCGRPIVRGIEAFTPWGSAHPGCYREAEGGEPRPLSDLEVAYAALGMEVYNTAETIVLTIRPALENFVQAVGQAAVAFEQFACGFPPPPGAQRRALLLLVCIASVFILLAVWLPR